MKLLKNLRLKKQIRKAAKSVKKGYEWYMCWALEGRGIEDPSESIPGFTQRAFIDFVASKYPNHLQFLNEPEGASGCRDAWVYPDSRCSGHYFDFLIIKSKFLRKVAKELPLWK